MRAFPAYVKEHALTLLRTGKSTSCAAGEAGVSIPTLTRWAYAAKVTLPNLYQSPVKDKIREALRRESDPQDRRCATRIAKALNVCVTYVMAVRRSEFGGAAPSSPRGYDRRKELGICTQCGRWPPATDCFKCRVCLNAQRERNRRYAITARPLRRRSDLSPGGHLAGLSLRRSQAPIDDHDDRAQLARIRAWAKAAGVVFE